MPDYEKLYAILFNAATDAQAALKQLNIGEAEEILRKAQCAAEELYLSAGE